MQELRACLACFCMLQTEGLQTVDVVQIFVFLSSLWHFSVFMVFCSAHVIDFLLTGQVSRV